MTRAAVVGSGPNGLAAAIVLARSGVEVTVLETDSKPGGGLRSAELTLPGVLHDEGSAFHPMGQLSPFFASLDLARHGLTWRWPQIDLAHPLDDGRVAILSREPGRTAASLGADGRRWRRLFDPLIANAELIAEDVFQPVLHRPRHFGPFVKFATAAALPASTFVRQFDDEPAKALFMGCAAHSFARLDRPLTASVGLLLAMAGEAVGWPVAEGGSQAIARALVRELEGLGVKVLTGCEVSEFAQVAEYCDGPVDLVMLDTSVEAALRISEGRLSPHVQRGLTRFQYGPAAFKLDLAIDGPVPWTNPQAARAGTVHLGGTGEQIAAAERSCVAGEMPDSPFVLVGQQHLADPSRANGSITPLWTYAHVPHGYRGDVSGAIMRQLERFAPGISEQVVATAVRGPQQFQERNANYVGGDIGSGANNMRQLIFRPRFATNPYRLAERLYLCSAATAPGAGVHGMCGRNAAESALRDL